MIKIENVEVTGWAAAVRGMRNPLNSWDKSDSIDMWGDGFYVGDNDLDLMCKLASAGSDHAKYRRFINVTFDLVSPLYFLKEWDTYKVSTVSNSCSTMHKIHAKEFTLDDFSTEHLTYSSKEQLKRTIRELNYNRSQYLNWSKNSEHDRKDYWWQMIQLLPSSYNQRRTVQLNYEVLTNMYHSRKYHKLDEWKHFCTFIEQLPHSEIITD